jgi:hypothetical protein
MSKLDRNFIFYKQQRELYISERAAEVTYRSRKIFRSILRISLPPFLFEFLVETASNRMIDIRSNKGFKAFKFIYLLFYLKI